MIRVGLLLGSFDPIHVGHIENAVRVLNNKSVDYIYFIPAQQNPWKKNQPAPFWDRMRLIQNALTSLQGSYERRDHERRIQVSDIESRFKEEDKPVYSYQVLEKISDYLGKEIFPGKPLEFYIICGTDVAREIHNWKEGEWILKNYKILEIDRPGYTNSEKGINVSSSMIRDMIGKGECPVPYITTENWDYITEHGLYTE